jgi:hypothetical protein
MLLKRALPVGAVLIAAGSIVWSAGAASAVSEHKITEMERIAPVTIKHGPTPGERHYEYAGIAEGHIGTLLVRGAALRSSGALNTGSGIETLHVTEFDGLGSRSAVIHEFFKITDGRSTFTGEGKWRGGQGHYHGAHGTFEVTGGGPVEGIQIVRLAGNISY